jgi:uncharacterized protein with HEPN domain
MTRKRALRVPEYLQHVLDAIDRATSCVAGMDVEGFEADTRTQDAVLHSLQVIGEAANKIRVAAPELNNTTSDMTPSGAETGPELN